MEIFELSRNIVSLRKKKGVTQETFADFMGVTKASVSKWENGQSSPDITLLPLIAAYFDISIDELIGYHPQLSKEQIQKLYGDFREAFAKKEFDEVMEELRGTVKTYYSCFSWLIQVCVLYLNHAPLANDKLKVMDLLKEGGELCQHIIDNCKNQAICREAISIKTLFDFQLGNIETVIETLEPLCDPLHMYQDSVILAQAYVCMGKKEQAISFIQMNMYLYIFQLIALAGQYLTANKEDKNVCYITMERIEELVRVFKLDELNPNSIANYYYQAAASCALYGDKEGTLACLKKFQDDVLVLCADNNYKLHGDDYFNQMETYFNELPLGTDMPRDMSFIKQTVLASLSNPAFACVQDSKEFQNLIRRMEEK